MSSLALIKGHVVDEVILVLVLVLTSLCPIIQSSCIEPLHDPLAACQECNKPIVAWVFVSTGRSLKVIYVLTVAEIKRRLIGQEPKPILAYATTHGRGRRSA